MVETSGAVHEIGRRKKAVCVHFSSALKKEIPRKHLVFGLYSARVVFTKSKLKLMISNSSHVGAFSSVVP